MEQNMNMGTQMPQEKKSIGSVIGIIVIVLVLVGGAYYFLKQVPTEQGGDTLTNAEISADQSISDLSTQGKSTILADIQKDLDATDFSGIETGLADITI